MGITIVPSTRLFAEGGAETLKEGRLIVRAVILAEEENDHRVKVEALSLHQALSGEVLARFCCEYRSGTCENAYFSEVKRKDFAGDLAGELEIIYGQWERQWKENAPGHHMRSPWIMGTDFVGYFTGKTFCFVIPREHPMMSFYLSFVMCRFLDMVEKHKQKTGSLSEEETRYKSTMKRLAAFQERNEEFLFRKTFGTFF